MQSTDFEWFKNNMPSLFAEYGEKYLAIKDQCVLGAYDTYSEGVNATKKTETIGSFIIQRCGADASAYTNYISSINFG